MVVRIVGSAYRTASLVLYPTVGFPLYILLLFMRHKRMSIWFTASTRETDKQTD